MSFYELRIYSIEPGRMNEMLARMQGPLQALFRRHGIAVVDHWTVIAGPHCPSFVYLMEWSGWAQREAAWGGFYADPEWHRVRAETNRGSELVERYELQLMRAVVPWRVPRAGISCHEMVSSQCTIGASGEAYGVIREQLPRRLAQHGAELLGAFEFVTGADLPRFAFWLGWKDRAERDAGGDLLFIKPLGRAQRWLLDRPPLDAASARHAFTSIKETNP